MAYVILTDSAANLPNALIEENAVDIVSLEFLIKGEPYKSYVPGESNDLARFYEMMRQGEHITTSAVNSHTWAAAIEPHLVAGHDVLVIAFSSGLSATAQEARTACVKLSRQYPERSIVCIDSLCAALGQGMFVMYAVENRKNGMTLAENAAWLEAHKMNMAHWFTVETLTYLKRGGRVSGATAILGNLMSIKPILHVDNNGKLVSVAKSRGRKSSLDALVERLTTTITEPENQTIYISHGDCLSDAQYIADKVRALFPVRDVVINTLDPVIGAHSGPGTMALFFLASER